MYSIEKDYGGGCWVVDHVTLVKEKLPDNWEFLSTSTKNRIADTVYRTAMERHKIDIEINRRKAQMLKSRNMLDVSHLDIIGTQTMTLSSITNAYVNGEPSEEEKMMWEPGLSEPDNGYKKQLQSLDFNEKINNLLNYCASNVSSWESHGPIDIAGFTARGVEVFNFEKLMNGIMSSDYIVSVNVPVVATSRFSSPGNVVTDKLNIVAVDNGDVNISDGSRIGSILVALELTCEDGYTCSMFVVSRVEDVVNSVFTNFRNKLNALHIEKFIHKCKKNVMENYDPSLTYTKIDEIWWTYAD